MIATGRGLVRIADQMTVHGQQLRRFDRHDELVSEAERQHRLQTSQRQAGSVVHFASAIYTLRIIAKIRVFGLEGVADGGAASAAFLQVAFGYLMVPDEIDHLRAAVSSYIASAIPLLW